MHRQVQNLVTWATLHALWMLKLFTHSTWWQQNLGQILATQLDRKRPKAVGVHLPRRPRQLSHPVRQESLVTQSRLVRVLGRLNICWASMLSCSNPLLLGTGSRLGLGYGSVPGPQQSLPQSGCGKRQVPSLGSTNVPMVDCLMAQSSHHWRRWKVTPQARAGY